MGGTFAQRAGTTVFLLCFAYGCSDDLEQPGVGGASSAAVDASVKSSVPYLLADREIDLSEVIDRAPLAFYSRRGDGSFETATTNWYARAARDSFTVVPAGWASAQPPEGGVELSTATIRRGTWTWSTGEAFDADGKGGLARESGIVTEWLRATDEGVEQGWTLASRPQGTGHLEVAVNVGGVVSAEAIATGVRLDTEAGAVVYGHATWIEADGDRASVDTRWHGGQLLISVPSGVVDAAAFPVVLDPVIGPETPTDPYAWVPLVPFGGQAVCTPTGCIDAYLGTWSPRTVRFALDGSLIDPQTVWSPLFETVTDRVAVGDDVALISEGPAGGVQISFVDTNGVLQSPPLVLDSTGSHDHAAVGCSQSQCLAAWHTATNDLVAQRVAPDGTLIDTAPFYVATNPSPMDTAIGWNGSNFLLTAGFGYRIAPDGSILDPLITGVGNVTKIVSDGTDWLVHRSLSHRIVHADGTTGPIFSHGITENADVAWAGGVYVMAGNSYYTVFDSSGAPIGAAHFVPGIFTGSPLTANSVAAAPGGGAFVVFESDKGGALVKVDVAGNTVLGPITLGHRAADQVRPFLVAGSDQYLLLWSDDRILPEGGLLGMRLSAAGQPLDSVPFFVVADPGEGLAAAFNGTMYAAVTNAPINGRAMRITTAGVVLDPGGIAFDMAGTNWAMTSDGNNFLVANGNISTSARLFFPNGTFGSATFGTIPGYRCSVAFNGTQYLLVANDSGTMRYRTITPGGISGPIMTAPLGANNDTPSTACVGATCLIGTQLEFLTLPLAPAQLNAPLLLSQPRVVGAGSEFVVVAPEAPPDPDRLIGARFTVANPPAQIGDWFTITQSTMAEQFAPTVATLGDNGALVAYVRYDTAVERPRIFLRHMALAAPPGSICTLDADCLSSHCVDGFCCDEACGGNVTGDCQTCAASLGASADGVCTVRAAGSVCRAAAGPCDAQEVCDGTLATCPANSLEPAGQVCRASAGDCDLAEFCSGFTAACPADLKNVGFACRPASGPCDAGETCGMVGNVCPVDLVVAAGTSCRGSAGACDIAETCDGSAKTCPADALQPPGTSCRAAVAECDVAETCTGSVAACPADGAAAEDSPCGPAPAGACDAVDACQGLVGATATCAPKFAPDGTECESGGICQAGACEAGTGGASTGGGSSTGGSTSEGGGSSTGGNSSNGGSSTNGGGSADGGSAASGGSAPDDGSGEGCSCRSAGHAPAHSAWGLVFLAVLLRRRERAAQTVRA